MVNLFNGWMFSFDEANIYHRNSAWYIYTAFTLVCIIACSAMCIKYRKAISKTMFAVLMFYSYVPVIAIIVQAYMRRSYEDSPESVEKEVSSYMNSIRTGFGYQVVFAVCDASKAYYSYDGISKHEDNRE